MSTSEVQQLSGGFQVAGKRCLERFAALNSDFSSENTAIRSRISSAAAQSVRASSGHRVPLCRATSRPLPAHRHPVACKPLHSTVLH
jgi:hypothetical protein